MDWLNARYLLLAPPAVLIIWWTTRNSVHPMSAFRRRALLIVRSIMIALLLLALAGPAIDIKAQEEAVMFVMDHSESQGEAGMRAAYERASAVADSLPRGTLIGVISAGSSPVLRCMPTDDRDAISEGLTVDAELTKFGGAETDLEQAVELACGLFPPGASRRVILVGDGIETRGRLERAASSAAVRRTTIDVIAIAGESRPDIRVAKVRPSRSCSHEGASISISADLESSLSGKGSVHLFENGVEVDSREIEVKIGDNKTEVFRRTPDRRDLYTYLVRVQGFEKDSIPDNNEALTLVDVRGKPRFLYVEGEESEAHYLLDSMAREGIRLEVRPPEGIPDRMEDLVGYDGIVISDVPAHKLTVQTMNAIRDYVELLGGGFVMVGGRNSFGVGGYYRTPIEDILPVKMKSPDTEERYATALVLVIDRSGSMSGQKIEICKSAAIATSELLTAKDYIGVVAFDSSATWIVPLTRASSRSTISGQIATINAGGGTNIYPGMVAARDALASSTAKVKHMIVLSDGHSSGSGYQPLAMQLKGSGVTVSTVAVGGGADGHLLSSIASAGGGKFYGTTDPSNIPRIFTQDAMTHVGRLVREEAFKPTMSERHVMLKGWPVDAAPELLGYVKTVRRATTQVPLVTDRDDPLLAHWRYGLGKVTAFTSDCKSRWATLWIAGWQGYGQFWAQVLRETAREPQGRNMDIRVDTDGQRASIEVDVMEDAARFANGVRAEAQVYFVPAASLGSAMESVAKVFLDQEGPGRYAGDFTVSQAGVYLVRAVSGRDTVSAGIAHDVSAEAATGQVNTHLLEKVCTITGGKMLAEGEIGTATNDVRSRHAELAPWILMLALLVFVADLVIRRWENASALARFLRRA